MLLCRLERCGASSRDQIQHLSQLALSPFLKKFSGTLAQHEAPRTARTINIGRPKLRGSLPGSSLRKGFAGGAGTRPGPFPTSFWGGTGTRPGPFPTSFWRGTGIGSFPSFWGGTGTGTGTDPCPTSFWGGTRRLSSSVAEKEGTVASESDVPPLHQRKGCVLIDVEVFDSHHWRPILECASRHMTLEEVKFFGDPARIRLPTLEWLQEVCSAGCTGHECSFVPTPTFADGPEVSNDLIIAAHATKAGLQGQTVALAVNETDFVTLASLARKQGSDVVALLHDRAFELEEHFKRAEVEVWSFSRFPLELVPLPVASRHGVFIPGPGPDWKWVMTDSGIGEPQFERRRTSEIEKAIPIEVVRDDELREKLVQLGCLDSVQDPIMPAIMKAFRDFGGGDKWKEATVHPRHLAVRELLESAVLERLQRSPLHMDVEAVPLFPVSGRRLLKGLMPNGNSFSCAMVAQHPQVEEGFYDSAPDGVLRRLGYLDEKLNTDRHEALLSFARVPRNARMMNALGLGSLEHLSLVSAAATVSTAISSPSSPGSWAAAPPDSFVREIFRANGELSHNGEMKAKHLYDLVGEYLRKHGEDAPNNYISRIQKVLWLEDKLTLSNRLEEASKIPCRVKSNSVPVKAKSQARPATSRGNVTGIRRGTEACVLVDGDVFEPHHWPEIKRRIRQHCAIGEVKVFTAHRLDNFEAWERALAKTGGRGEEVVSIRGYGDDSRDPIDQAISHYGASAGFRGMNVVLVVGDGYLAAVADYLVNEGVEEVRAVIPAAARGLQEAFEKAKAKVLTFAPTWRKSRDGALWKLELTSDGKFRQAPMTVSERIQSQVVQDHVPVFEELSRFGYLDSALDPFLPAAVKAHMTYWKRGGGATGIQHEVKSLVVWPETLALRDTQNFIDKGLMMQNKGGFLFAMPSKMMILTQADLAKYGSAECANMMLSGTPFLVDDRQQHPESGKLLACDCLLHFGYYSPLSLLGRADADILATFAIPRWNSRILSKYRVRRDTPKHPAFGSNFLHSVMASPKFPGIWRAAPDDARARHILLEAGLIENVEAEDEAVYEAMEVYLRNGDEKKPLPLGYMGRVLGVTPDESSP